VNREIKFRAWDKEKKKWFTPTMIGGEVIDWESHDDTCRHCGEIVKNRHEINYPGDFALIQYTGLKDSEGKEIYELHEINNKYRVVYEAPSYVLQDISNGDIINIYDEQYKNGLKITGEYSEL